MTVDNMRGFSTIFASQAQDLKKERRKTEDLLTEMLPRSVAKSLRAGKTVEAEEYEVREGTRYAPYVRLISVLAEVYHINGSERGGLIKRKEIKKVRG